MHIIQSLINSNLALKCGIFSSGERKTFFHLPPDQLDEVLSCKARSLVTHQLVQSPHAPQQDCVGAVQEEAAPHKEKRPAEKPTGRVFGFGRR